MNESDMPAFYGEDTYEVRTFMERWSYRLFWVAAACSILAVLFA